MSEANESSEIPLNPDEKLDLLNQLFKKAADTKRMGEEANFKSTAATNEAKRQIKQVAQNNTITKSGKE